MKKAKKRQIENPPEMYIQSWEAFSKSESYPVKPISVLLKLCGRLPDVEESELIDREWQINKEELG